MSFLCKKSISLGGKNYTAGNIIPEGVVLDSRKRALIANGYIAEMNTEKDVAVPGGAVLFSQEELDAKIAEAVSKLEQMQSEKQQYIEELQQDLAVALENVAVLEETDESFNGAVPISIKTGSEDGNEQFMALPMRPEELQQVFSIMQLNAEEGIKEIAGVQSENVLIVLHAVDSRVTIKKAAEKQADTLNITESNSDEADSGKQTTEDN